MGAGKRARAAARPEQGPGAADAAEPDAVPPDAVPLDASGVGPAGRSPATEPGAATRVLETRNEVLLVGRVAAPAEERTLPSGDLLASWRLVVDRPRDARPLPEGVRTSTVDTFPCVAWRAGLRRTARGLAAGDVVRVEGALRRRFWRTGGGTASMCEVEVSAVTRLTRAAP